MNIGYEAYTAWAPVTIDAGVPEKGDGFFTFTPSGLTFNVSQFDGWLGKLFHPRVSALFLEPP